MSRPLDGCSPAPHFARGAGIASTAAQGFLFQERETKVRPFVREALFDCFPELREDSAVASFHRQMFNHLLSPARVDIDTGGKIIPCQLVAQFAGTKWNHGFVARKWLDAFRYAFGERMGITISRPSRRESKARTILVDWPVPVQDTLAQADFYTMSTDDLGKARNSDLVYLLSGEKVTSRKLGCEKQDLIAIRECVSDSLPPKAMQRPLQILLNDHLTKKSQAIHTALLEGMPILRGWLDGYLLSPYQTQYHGEPMNPDGQRRFREWLTILPAQLAEPPLAGYYHSGGKSVRLHSKGFIPHYLPREGRAALFQRLTRLDLRNSQFAIAARLWGAKTTLRILGGGSIWDHFLRELSLEPAVKPALKTCSYALCFGMARRRLSPYLTWELRDAGFTRKEATGIAKRFLGSDVMLEMLEARDRALQQIRDRGGVHLPDWAWQGTPQEGAWLDLDNVPSHWLDPEAEMEETQEGAGAFEYQAGSAYEASVRSLLAQQMQAAEMGVMLAATEVIAKTPDITVVSFLHDGLTLHFRDGAKRKQQTRAIQKAVSRHCVEKGYPTSLELETG